MTGIVGNKWWFDKFSPMDVIPSTVCLTVYDGGSPEFREAPLEDKLDEVVEAHRTMEENKAGGKIVVWV
jgi:hypothetical protein